MNERIQELKDKAWATCEEPEQYMDKFAELLVKECIEQCQSNDVDVDRYSDESDHGVHLGVQECVQSLKQHFGVEE
jgi:hypothetical protein